jgi:hypothetical protein
MSNHTLTQDSPTPSLGELLNRDIAMHRAAQTLADATRCRLGLAPSPLTQLDPHDREWFKQTARNLIEIFETITMQREPDAEREQRERRSIKAARRLENRLYEARARGGAAAKARGHELGVWICPDPKRDPGHERAQCQACGRTVFINIASDPIFSGMAVVAGCMAIAEPTR